MIRIVTLFFILLLSRYQLFSQTNGLSLVAHLDQKHGTGSGVSYNGIWGYTAPDGREYAILGTYTGTAIIDITDSASEVAFITGPSSLWREMRTYKNYAYVVTEAGGGVQIIDLAQLPATATLVQSFNYISGGKNILRSHSLEIFDSVLYLNGCAGWSPGGAVFFSLTNPTAPQFLGEYAGRYLHDSYVRNDTLYGAAINSGGGIDIVNIANKATPSLIARITYTGSGTHNTWTTTDGKYVISTDEIGSTAKNLKFWNLQTLPTPPSSPSATYTFSPSDIVHNVTVRGKYAYVAWYTAGTIVVDISDPLNPQTAGWYDSYPGASGSYDGVWSIYPYFPSGKIISGDMQTGLYVTEFNGLQPRIPVQNISPAENSILPLSTPITFQWTRTANNSNDPHYYQLHIFGYKVDTTFRTNDTTITPAITSLLYEAKPYRWHIISCDDFNTTIEPDTFLFYYGSVSTVGSLSGITFLDSNGNGSKEVGERFLSQRKIKLSGLQTDSVLTDVDGAYSFNNLSPGNYSVQIENQSGWYQTLPSSPNGYSRDVVAGGDITGINFGVTRFASVRGMKFHDVNGNGVNNGGDETGISEWMIFLSGEINDTQTTDVNGFYSFENLPVGAYVLREENRVGWTHTFPPSGLHSFTLLSGDSATGKNFGNYKFASITGTKFHDRDGDGEKDGNEEGLANWKIFLSGARVDSTVTGNDGNYSFQNLPAGNYFLQERTQSGWVQTFPPFTQYSYTLISGDSLTEQNFGNFRLGKISGKKFHDANANGLFDNGEAGLSNWKIKLFGVGYETTATNVNGEFSFSSVLAGTYTLSEIQKSGWEQTFPPTNSYTVSMVSGTDTSSLLFGNYQRSSISGTVFEDNNGNGVKEGSDAGLQNWTVYLFSPDTSTVVDSLLTGEEGYTFFGLTPGTYFLRAEQNNGWVQTSATTNEFEISSGSFISAANVGFFEYGTITGKTFNDLD
ncbi:MAG: choice-of-anchor B family protein, partial [Ignavibacteriales bacterium]|nr:choice-of-anchor B family protein [Ignavibacteriales bacterium]